MTKKQELQLYLWGWIMLLLALVAGLIIKWCPLKLSIPCIFRSVTGLYCPGCGGTRAVWELLHGHVLRSLWYHPVVVYGVTVYVVYMISHTIELVSGGRYSIGMRYRNGYLYVAVGLLLLHFALSNFLLLVFHITL